MISPGRRLCGVASPDWGTAVVQIPWDIYLYFGNKEALETYYGEMKQWVDHIAALTENDIVPYGLGDWCPPNGNAAIDCPIPVRLDSVPLSRRGPRFASGGRTRQNGRRGALCRPARPDRQGFRR